jgi:hypothetical protein
LSEQAKLVYLQERIRDTKRRERGGLASFVIGVILAAVGFGLNDPRFLGLGGTLMGIGGVILAVIGSIEWLYYMYQYNRYMEDLKKMTVTIPKCPKCGRELPQGNFAFCPFCGVSLEGK